MAKEKDPNLFSVENNEQLPKKEAEVLDTIESSNSVESTPESEIQAEVKNKLSEVLLLPKMMEYYIDMRESLESTDDLAYEISHNAFKKMLSTHDIENVEVVFTRIKDQVTTLIDLFGEDDFKVLLKESPFIELSESKKSQSFKMKYPHRLGEAINEDRKMSLPEIQKTMRQLMFATFLLEENGLEHGDISPDVIALDNENEAYLAGLESVHYLEESETNKGEYQPPTVDDAVFSKDVYALGVIWGQLLTKSKGDDFWGTDSIGQLDLKEDIANSNAETFWRRFDDQVRYANTDENQLLIKEMLSKHSPSMTEILNKFVGKDEG